MDTDKEQSRLIAEVFDPTYIAAKQISDDMMREWYDSLPPNPYYKQSRFGSLGPSFKSTETI